MMDNLKKLKDAFSKVLEISEENAINELTYNSIQEWDLIRHMGLITEIETILFLEISKMKRKYDNSNHCMKTLIQPLHCWYRFFHLAGFLRFY